MAAISSGIKRRRVSAVRTFPKGCGPAVPAVDRMPCNAPPAPSEPQHAEPSNSAEKDLPSDHTEESRKSSCGSKQVGNLDASASVFLNSKSGRPDHPKRRRVSAIRSFPPGCGRNAPQESREEHERAETKKLDGSKSVVDQEALMEQHVMLASTKTAEIVEAKKYCNQTQKSGREICTEVRVEPPSSATESTLGCNREYTVDKNSQITVDKNSQIIESRRSVGKFIDKMSKTSMGEIAGKESMRKSEGQNRKLTVDKNSQISISRQPGSKLVDERGKALVGKAADKGSMGNSELGKKVDKGLTENQEHPEDRTSKGFANEGNGSLQAHGDRLIVQCLMAAPNCPWRRGRSSTTPKTKTMKGGNSSSKDFRTSLPAHSSS